MTWQHLAETIPELTPKLRMKLIVELLKLSTGKQKRIPYQPETAVSNSEKISFVLKHQQ